ncbi:Isopenicillin N synthase [Paramyrothecium foliicola]|nr:Isopenicillin N synthase [Paramyrothecium foliicola]
MIATAGMTQNCIPGYTTVELLTLQGPEFRRVSTAKPREATLEEIPVIDISGINGSTSAKKVIAAKIRTAAEGSGFFYIKNHTIPPEVIEKALVQAKAFFSQPQEAKEPSSSTYSKNGNGWSAKGRTQINRSETKDLNEHFSWRYDPKYDPTIDDVTQLSPSALKSCGGEDFVWETTRHIPGFKDDTLNWWNHCLSLARSLIRIFALALDLPEDYFDNVTTHPGADGLYLHYPGTTDAHVRKTQDVGIGSHTDIQCFTLLWQDMSGGLQVLSRDEWIQARPIEGTFVVNIADFLQRLSNNRFRSTVHRVYNVQTTSRYSMPFFFGFNHDSDCSVVETCIDQDHPALYEPISCGEVCFINEEEVVFALT